jgi:TRAP-type C4-dicarboxylate transport system substrate-binding protein
MSPKRYAELPPDVKQAIDATTGQVLTDKFGAWWNKWDQAGLDAVKPLNHEIVRVDDATREKWRADLKPVIDGELAKLEKEGIANARAIYDEMRKQVARFAKK